VMARAARHRESDAASRRAYVWADVATRFGGTSEGLARICRCSINVVLAEPGLADARSGLAMPGVSDMDPLR
jgi:hypothetical protein